MISKTLCLLFSESYSAVTNELAADRTLATVPFAGRYRLIDFVLSSLVKARVNNIGILTKEHYGSLVDHVGAGKDWDLDRKNGGLKILTPFANPGSETTRNRSKIDALLSCQTYLEESNEEYVILADSNIVMNIDFADLVRYHNDKGADITIVYQQRNDAVYNGLVIDQDRDGRVVDAYYAAGQMTDCQNQVLKIFVFNKELLMNLLGNALDNALEGTRGGADRRITVRCKADKGLFMLRVENTLGGEVKPDLATTKADKTAHGFGIPGMREIAERYGGSLDAGVRDGRFELVVCLPLPRQEDREQK